MVDAEKHLALVYVRQEEEPIDGLDGDFGVQCLAVQVDRGGEDFEVYAFLCREPGGNLAEFGNCLVPILRNDYH